MKTSLGLIVKESSRNQILKYAIVPNGVSAYELYKTEILIISNSML